MSENGTDIQLANFEEKCLNLLQNCTLTDVGLRRPVFRLLFDSVLPENVFELNLLPKNLKTDDSDSTCELQAGISTNCSEKEFNSVRQCYSEIDTFEVLRSEDVCITNVDGFCEVSFQNFLLSKTPLFYNYNFRPFYFHMKLKQLKDSSPTYMQASGESTWKGNIPPDKNARGEHGDTETNGGTIKET